MEQNKPCHKIRKECLSLAWKKVDTIWKFEPYLLERVQCFEKEKECVGRLLKEKGKYVGNDYVLKLAQKIHDYIDRK